jgi:hypothetical protein
MVVVVVVAAKEAQEGEEDRHLEELLEKHPEFEEIFIDGTEQELPKPKDKGRRKDLYSGKRKRHTAKMQVLSTRKKLILHLCRHVPGGLVTTCFLEPRE